MSGLPFDPMRKEPPPPPHIDTVSFNASEYIVVRSRDHQEFIVHRDCLRESPFLRRAFAKRQTVRRDDLVVEFDANAATAGKNESFFHDVDDDGSFASGGEEATNDGSTQNAAMVSSPVEEGSPRSRKAQGRSASLPFAPAAEPAGAEADATSFLRSKSTAPPLVLTETLHLDKSVTLTFPTTTGATLDIIISYLYYKHRYERKLQEPRPPFSVPSGSAISVMKLAHLLEC